LEWIRELMQLWELDQATITELQKRVKQLADCNSHLQNKLTQIKSQRKQLTWKDFSPGGWLVEFVADFTYFGDYETK
jgi:hypothetical protein